MVQCIPGVHVTGDPYQLYINYVQMTWKCIESPVQSVYVYQREFKGNFKGWDFWKFEFQMFSDVFRLSSPTPVYWMIEWGLLLNDKCKHSGI